MQEIDERFDGVARIYSNEDYQTLKKSHIAVVGIGGVGSWASESLVRSGVGEITIVDLDDICVSNTNRQIHAHDGNYGKLKVHAMKERLLNINPNLKINCVEDYFSESNKDEIFKYKFDYVIDCIDSMRSKCILISECYKRDIKVFTTGGAGGKFDPRHVRIRDLNRSHNDKLLLLVRTNLKRFYNFPKTKALYGIHCVFSPEFKTLPDQVCEAKSLNCQNGYGSLSHITGIFGLMAAGFVVNDLLNKESRVEIK